MVRPGAIDDFDTADELEQLVGRERARNLSRHTAAEPLRIVRLLLATPNIDCSMIEIDHTKIIIHCPAEPEKTSAIRAEIAGLGLTENVTFQQEVSMVKADAVRDDASRHVQRLLFQ